MSFKAVIPAAGLGTRMLPATKTVPKEMLPVFDRPAISYIVKEAVDAGIKDILIISSRGKESMENYFDKNYELEERLKRDRKFDLLETITSTYNNARISFVRQIEPKGLGDAVLSAKTFVGNDPFAILYGDDIIAGKTPAVRQLMDVYEKTHCPVLGIKRVPHERISRFGCVELEEKEKGLFKVLSMVEKPPVDKAPSDFAILGRVIMTPDIFPILEEGIKGKNGEVQLTDAMAELLKRKDFYACPFKGTHFDTGNKVEFLRASIMAGLASSERREVKEMLRSIQHLIK